MISSALKNLATDTN